MASGRRPALDAALLLALAGALVMRAGGALASLWPGPIIERLLVAAVIVVVSLVAVRAVWLGTFPRKATRTLVEIGITSANRPPRLVHARRSGHSWHLAWRVPAGVSV